MDTSINNISAHPSVRLSPDEFRMTTVLVGPDKTRFDVHQDLLTFHSDFFKAALTGRFREAFEKIVTIPSVDPVTFEFFVYWLNKGSFPEESDASARLLNDWVADDDDAIKTENLIQLYVFGEMYSIKELKLSALRELFWFMAEPQTELPNGKQVRYAHDNLPASSPLLAYLVDLFCAYAGEEVWEDDCDVRFPAVFVTAVLRRYAEYARGDRGHHDDLDLCDYHNHQDDSESEGCPDRAVLVI